MGVMIILDVAIMIILLYGHNIINMGIMIILDMLLW